MKRVIIGALCAAYVAVAFSAVPERKSVKDMTPEEREAYRAMMIERRLKHTGGMVDRPNTQKGEIVYINCQKAADAKWLGDSVAYFIKETKCKVTLKDGAFSFPPAKIEGNATIYIVDDKALPGFLVEPEDNWALVNVAPLKAGAGEKPAFLEARVRKELARAFCYLCGAVGSQFNGTLLEPMPTPAELDERVDARLPVDVLQRVRNYMRREGIMPQVTDTYRHACQEGWAAQPTNDYQKAIWNEIRAIPAAPLKLEK